MRRLALLTLILFAAACTSTSSVPIAPMRAQTTDTAVLRDEAGEEIRLDANSDLRFQRRDGSWTPWRSAAELWVNREGVLIPYAVAGENLDGVAITGLEDTEIEELLAADFALENGALVRKGRVRDWLTGYVAAHPIPNGTWGFRANDGTWFEGLTGAHVAKVARDGIAVNDGLRWSDMVSAEVKNVSGSKTLVGVVAVTAVAVSIVPLVLLTKGKIGELPLRVGGAVVETGARVAVHASFHGCCYVASGPTASKSSPTVVPRAEEGTTLWTAGYEPPAGDGAHRLFSSNARRRATIRVGAAFDYAAPVAQHGAWAASLGGLIRFMDLVDLGVGVRSLGVGAASDRFFFARVGMHAELDARRRFALPLSIDLGGGGPVNFHARVNFGLRVRVVDAWWLGIHPFNPTYTRYEPGSRLAGMPYLGFPTMIETTFAF